MLMTSSAIYVVLTCHGNICDDVVACETNRLELVSFTHVLEASPPLVTVTAIVSCVVGRLDHVLLAKNSRGNVRASADHGNAEYK